MASDVRLLSIGNPQVNSGGQWVDLSSLPAGQHLASNIRIPFSLYNQSSTFSNVSVASLPPGASILNASGGNAMPLGLAPNANVPLFLYLPVPTGVTHLTGQANLAFSGIAARDQVIDMSEETDFDSFSKLGAAGLGKLDISWNVPLAAVADAGVPEQEQQQEQMPAFGAGATLTDLEVPTGSASAGSSLVGILGGAIAGGLIAGPLGALLGALAGGAAASRSS